MRGDFPIDQVGLKRPIETGITYSLEYDAWRAVERFGGALDLWKWEQGQYPRWFMEKVIAFHHLRLHEQAHTSDAVADAIEQDRKMKR